MAKYGMAMVQCILNCTMGSGWQCITMMLLLVGSGVGKVFHGQGSSDS